MRVLMLGDICSTPGRTVIKEHLQEIIDETAADFVTVNGENASGGHGLTEKNAKDLLSLPIDCITMGNHVWNQKETEGYIGDYEQMVRPANYPEPCPGRGYTFLKWKDWTVAVANLSGQTFMPALDSPFRTFDKIYEKIKGKADILLVDFHGETTSEKIAFGYHLDGRATVVVGTHTHVQTADNRILPKGTAYITDMGMTGCLNGVIGVQKDIVIQNMMTMRPKRFEMEKNKPWQINGVLVEIDEATKQAINIQRIYKIYE